MSNKKGAYQHKEIFSEIHFNLSISFAILAPVAIAISFSSVVNPPDLLLLATWEGP